MSDLSSAAASGSVSDQMINPAPAQSSISATGSQQQASNEQIALQANEKERKIKSLNKKLRLISNIAGPIGDYVKFQQSMSPDIRVVLDVNQWMILMFGAKAGIKSWIDEEYMDITDPSSALKQNMEKAYSSIDTACNAFTSSMKEIVVLAQSRLSQPNSTSSNKMENNILTAMNDTSVANSLLPQ
jgi:hypothetical protein